MEEEIKKEIRKMTLQNAFEHEGETRDKIILGKILGTKPEFRTKVKEISIEISEIVSSVNKLSIDEQKKEIDENFPEILAPKEKIKEREGLPELKNAQQGNVITRFPPEPNGYPHIGHAKAAIINSEYAKMYGGKFILRMDDTNPEAERMEYHAAIKVGLEWLGIEFDIVKSTSDDMEVFYEKGMELINSGKAYICKCKRDDISKNRRERKACKCSREDLDKNISNWGKMETKFKPGEAIVRFRGDMEADNAVMRDPVLFRIIEGKHYTVGEKYRVWPSYDFAVAVEDYTDGITHALRSKEYELRNELYHAILDALGMKHPKMLEFSRLEFKGMPVSKRVLRPLIDEGKVSWYDDPRLPTLEGLRRRGIRPEAVKKFVLSLGLTKNDTVSPFASLEAFNKKIIDGKSVRLHMVRNPKELKIVNLPSNEFQLSNHPTIDLGKRTVNVNDSVMIDGQDAMGLKKGESIRLLGIGIVKIIEDGLDLAAEYISENAENIEKKIQWVTKETIKIKIIVPEQLFFGEEFNEDSLKEIEGFVEQAYLELKDGDEIQFIRFGYCRKESTHQVIFTHK